MEPWGQRAKGGAIRKGKVELVLVDPKCKRKREGRKGGREGEGGRERAREGGKEGGRERREG